LTAIGLGRGYFVAGMHSGHIYLFEGNRLKAFADAHKSGTGGKTGCQTLHLKTDPTRKQDAESVQFVSGGSDGQIILWDFKFPKKEGSEPRLEEIRNSRFNISSITPRPKNHCIKSVCWDGSLKNILIGTQGSEAYSIGTVTVVVWRRLFLLLLLVVVLRVVHLVVMHHGVVFPMFIRCTALRIKLSKKWIPFFGSRTNNGLFFSIFPLHTLFFLNRHRRWEQNQQGQGEIVVQWPLPRRSVGFGTTPGASIGGGDVRG
jgi:hypothetical protein